LLLSGKIAPKRFSLIVACFWGISGHFGVG
jgi:hypothetical protein